MMAQIAPSEEATVLFNEHRQVCRVCASDGAALCRQGLSIVRVFHDAIVAEILSGMRTVARA